MTEKDIAKKRTNQQNRYWRLLIRILAKHLNIDPELCHKLMAYKFMRAKRWNPILKDYEEYVRSSTEISIEEFSEIKEALQAYSMQMYGCYLPDPLENIKLDLE